MVVSYVVSLHERPLSQGDPLPRSDGQIEVCNTVFDYNNLAFKRRVESQLIMANHGGP